MKISAPRSLSKKTQRGAYPHGLAEKERERDRLARAGGTDDGEVTEIMDVEIESVGCLGGRFEKCDRGLPVQPSRIARRKGMAGKEPREIERRDHRAPGDVGEVSRKLCPEGRLEIEILPHPDHVHAGEFGAEIRDRAIELVRRFGETEQREVMITEDRFTCCQFVARFLDILCNACSGVIRCDHLPTGPVHPV